MKLKTRNTEEIKMVRYKKLGVHKAEIIQSAEGNLYIHITIILEFIYWIQFTDKCSLDTLLKEINEKLSKSTSKLF